MPAPVDLKEKALDRIHFKHVAIIVDVGQTVNVAIRRGDGKSGFLQLAETPAEVDVLFVAEFLVAKQQHRMRVERIQNRIERCVIQWIAQVEACDLGAEQGMQRL